MHYTDEINSRQNALEFKCSTKDTLFKKYIYLDCVYLRFIDCVFAGNFALFDQRLAMKWVHENIERFGGDRGKVTVFGESAGAGSTSCHFFSEESWPFFQRSILQSGSITFPSVIFDMETAKSVSEEFLSELKCKNDEHVLDCLQNLSTDEIMNHYRTTPYSMTKDFMLPVVDGDFFKELPAKMLEKGMYKRMDLMVGVCEHEGFLAHYVHLQKNQTTEFYVNYFEEVLRRTLNGFSEDVYKKALELYEPSCSPNYIEALRPTIDLETDRSWNCQTTKLAKMWSAQSTGENNYVFRFSYAPPLDILVYYPQGTFGFAAHASDLMVGVYLLKFIMTCGCEIWTV